MPIVRRRLAGNGAILLFHEVHEDPSTELSSGVSADFLDSALGWLTREGWDLVSLDECLSRMRSKKDEQRFAAITFDDGYRDTLSRALPILERHNAPAVVYVPTGAPERTLYSWWLGLRELFRTRETVVVGPMSRSFSCRDLPTKVAACATVVEWVHRDFGRAALLAPVFADAGLSLLDLNEQYFLAPDEIRRLAAHPLLTIGGHTTTHTAVAMMPRSTALREMAENRDYLRDLTGQTTRHFAFPYGTPAACGQRDSEIAAEAGFLSAVTTRHGLIGSAEKVNAWFLPRIGFRCTDTLLELDAKVSGLQQAFLRSFGRRQAPERTPAFGEA